LIVSLLVAFVFAPFVVFACYWCYCRLVIVYISHVVVFVSIEMHS